MPISAELQALQRAIADLRSGVNSLARNHGDLPVVARLRNDLERLILDVADVEALSPATWGAAGDPGRRHAGRAADRLPGQRRTVRSLALA